MRGAIFAVFIAFVLSKPTWALSVQDRNDLETAINQYVHAVGSGDWEAMLPPDYLIQVISDEGGVEFVTFKRELLERLIATMNSAPELIFEIDANALESATSEAGAHYAVLPSRMGFILDGVEHEFEREIFAAKLPEGWHLFTIEGDEAARFFLLAYPQYEGVPPLQ